MQVLSWDAEPEELFAQMEAWRKAYNLPPFEPDRKAVIGCTDQVVDGKAMWLVELPQRRQAFAIGMTAKSLQGILYAAVTCLNRLEPGSVYTEAIEAPEPAPVRLEDMN